MKKRNKYFLKEKKIIRLKKEDNDVFKAIHNQGWIELENPIHQGYYSEWVLRDDISRRKEVKAYQEALDISNDRIWSKNEDFRYKNRKTKKWEVFEPKLKEINKEKYNSLSLGAQKFFVEDTLAIRTWRLGFNDKTYICVLTFELVTSISKAFITRRREHDSILYQREAEIEKELYNVADDHPWGSYSNGKWWNKIENKKIKMVAERELRNELGNL